MGEGRAKPEMLQSPTHTASCILQHDCVVLALLQSSSEAECQLNCWDTTPPAARGRHVALDHPGAIVEAHQDGHECGRVDLLLDMV